MASAPEHTVHTEGSGLEEGHEGESHGGRFYLTTWLYLLFFTVFEVGLVVLDITRTLLVAGLLAFTVLKALFIIANFMHVRFERLSLMVVVAAPFIFALILFLGVVPDFAPALAPAR